MEIVKHYGHIEERNFNKHLKIRLLSTTDKNRYDEESDVEAGSLDQISKSGRSISNRLYNNALMMPLNCNYNHDIL